MKIGTLVVDGSIAEGKLHYREFMERAHERPIDYLAWIHSQYKLYGTKEVQLTPPTNLDCRVFVEMYRKNRYHIVVDDTAKTLSLIKQMFP